MSEPRQEGTWRPLLEGDLRQRAVAAIDAIATDLQDPPAASDLVDAPQLQRDIDETCLARGRAGFSAFYGFKALEDNDDEAARQAARHLEDAFERVARLRMSSSLFVGFSGVAWAAELLERELFRTSDDPNEEIDEILLRSVDSIQAHSDYDLISGFVGVGAYCLDRPTSTPAIKCLELITDRLTQLAEHTDKGIAWFTPPEMLPKATREEFAEGFYNLGMAHGMSGIIALLARIYSAGAAKESAHRLLDGAIRWLLGQRLVQDERSVFPAVVVPGRPLEPSRTAWCYGDAGIAGALLVAAEAVGEREWNDEAVRLATEVAQRPMGLCGVNDAGLCHGSSGIAHILNRLSIATGDEKLEDAARTWFERTLDMRNPGLGVGGFRTWRSGRGMHEGWIDHPGLLAGAAGVGLALLAAIGSVEPTWDRCLLLSTSPGIN